MEAYDLLLRSFPAFLSYTKEGNQKALQLCEQAVALDPQYSAAYMCIAGNESVAWIWGWNRDPQVIDHAFAFAQQAVTLDNSSPMAHSVLGDIYKMRMQLDQAIAEGQRSVVLGPSCAACYGELARTYDVCWTPHAGTGIAQ